MDQDYDFIAIDFETATPDMDSACAVGIAVVSGLRVENRFYSLIQPPGNTYDPANTAIHGISAADTKDAAPARRVLAPLLPLLESGIPLIAHNASFDMSVLRQYIDRSIDFKYMDTMDMMRSFRRSGGSLDRCADFLGIKLERHHNALDDAVACAQIAIACAERSPFERFSDYCLYSPHVKIYQFAKLKPIKTIRPVPSRPQRSFDTIRPCEITPTVETIDPASALLGKSIVFTGELSIDRHTAAQMAVNAGAVLKSGVSRKTDYLVVGKQDISLVGEDGMSGKEEKACALNAEGRANIKIISESEFLTLLGCETF